MEKIAPISLIEFNEKVKVNDSTPKINFLDYFQKYINMAPVYAIGPYFWFIPDNSEMKIVEVSSNISQLTPYSAKHWKNQGPDFLASLIHEDDRFYVLSSLQIAIETAQSLNPKDRNLIRINIYGRLLNAKSVYRWTLFQVPAFFFNQQNLVISGLIMITDMSRLNYVNSPMMTIIHFGNKRKQYFKINNFKTSISENNIPRITKRELEILQLMVRGLNSPQIAENLFLSYHTVENHKRNLRRKTGTKTTAELIDYVWRNNLI
jgi:DNA-binding CsgD family transcriptional regulator